jgi:inner membrane protein
VDNLTHTLFGLALADALAPPAATTGQRRLLAAAAVLAANAPDADLLYFGITAPPLGYLLHHRGHTHTLPGLVPQALLFFAAGALPPVRRRIAPIAGRFAAVVVLALLSHLVLDFGNSYGVHPFHPIDPRWFYGDAVFIIEPWLWALLGGPLLLRSTRPGRRGAVALAGWAAFVALSFALSGAARDAVRDAVSRDPRGALRDVIQNPNPLQPLCWVVITVEEDEAAGTYTLRRGMLSLRPDWQSPGGCPLYRLASRPSPWVGGPGLIWLDEITQPTAALRDLAARDCRVRAWMQFGRAPVIRDGRLFDLRFEAGLPGPRHNFTSLLLEGGGECPARLTSWGWPRADLVEP